MATEQRTAKKFPIELVSLKSLWLTSIPDPKRATHNPNKTILAGRLFLKRKRYSSVKTGAVVPRRVASAIEVSCTALKNSKKEERRLSLPKTFSKKRE